jgi:hypothetical protein
MRKTRRSIPKQQTLKRNIVRGKRRTIKGGINIQALDQLPLSIQKRQLQKYVTGRRVGDLNLKKMVKPVVKNEKLLFVPTKSKYVRSSSKQPGIAQISESNDLPAITIPIANYVPIYGDLFTDYIAQIQVTTVLSYVFEKYPIKRFSSYFGKDVGARQLSNIPELEANLNDELCSLDTSNDDGNCDVGFTADQWAKSKYCKTNYKSKGRFSYYDTGNKLCEYIPYAMQKLEDERNKLEPGLNHTLLFRRVNTQFHFVWMNEYYELLQALIRYTPPTWTEINNLECDNNFGRLQQHVVIDAQSGQMQIHIPLFAMLYNSVYSKIRDSQTVMNFTYLHNIMINFVELLNSCDNTSDICDSKIEQIQYMDELNLVFHQIDRNTPATKGAFECYMISNGSVEFIPIPVANIDEKQTKLDKSAELKRFIVQPLNIQISSIFNKLTFEDWGDCTEDTFINCKQRGMFVLYWLPIIMEDIITRLQEIISFKYFVRSQIQDTPVLPIMQDFIQNTMSTQLEITLPENMNWNRTKLFITQDKSVLSCMFYSLFTVQLLDNPETPMSYCLSSISLNIDLNDDNFAAHLFPVESNADCSSYTNVDSYADYPKTTIINYIQPYE